MRGHLTQIRCTLAVPAGHLLTTTNGLKLPRQRRAIIAQNRRLMITTAIATVPRMTNRQRAFGFLLNNSARF